MFSNIVSGFRNLWRWFPIIWKDRDWDYGFLLKILSFKLLRMSEAFYSKDAVTVSAKDKAHEMYMVGRILEVIEADKIKRMALKVHEDVWGKPVFVTRELESSGKKIVCLWWPKAANWREQQRAQAEFNYVSEFSNGVEERMWKYAFETMQEQLRSWWD